MTTKLLLIDEATGIHIPQKFYEFFDFNAWNIDKSLYSELSDPDQDYYWEAWEDMLDSAQYVDEHSCKWSLYQDGSLYAVREDHDWDQEM